MQKIGSLPKTTWLAVAHLRRECRSPSSGLSIPFHPHVRGCLVSYFCCCVCVCVGDGGSGQSSLLCLRY